MAGSGTVTVNIIGKADKLQSAFRDSEKSAKNFGDKLDGVGHKVGEFGKKVVAFGAVAGAALGAFAVKSVMAASDVEESLSKVNTIFGAQGKEIDAWAKGAAKNIGLSRGAALGAAGDFGNMFTQMGIGVKEAAKMSTGMVNLAADFASFHNADITEVINAQSAAFRGEYDSLQKYVPMINAANVEKKAMEMTGKANAKALTAEEKALAVNKLMYEGAGKAQGDFARTSGGLANQMRILKAEGENFVASVGSVLLPIALKGLTLFKEWSGIIKDALAPALTFIGETAKMVFDIIFKGDYKGGPFSEDSKFVDKVFDIRDSLINLKDNVVKVVETVVGWFRSFTDNFNKTKDDASSSAGQLMTVFNTLKDIVSSAFGAIKEVIKTAIDFVKGVWRVFGDDLLSFAREFIDNLVEAFRGFGNAISGVFDLIKAILTGKWGEAWEAVKKIVDGIWDGIFAVVRNAITNVIPTMLAGAGQLLSSAARTLFAPIKDAAVQVMNSVIWVFEKGLNLATAPFRAGAGLLNFFSSKVGVDVPEMFRNEIRLPRVPMSHAGGVIPGPLGVNRLIMAQGGERVLPRGASGSDPTRIVIQVDGRTLGEVTLNSLLDLQSRTGNLGIEAA